MSNFEKLPLRKNNQSIRHATFSQFEYIYIKSHYKKVFMSIAFYTTWQSHEIYFNIQEAY